MLPLIKKILIFSNTDACCEATLSENRTTDPSQPCLSSNICCPRCHPALLSFPSRRRGSRQAVFRPELHPHCGRDPAEKRKVPGSDGSRKVDPAPLLPGGLPLRGPLHSGGPPQICSQRTERFPRSCARILRLCCRRMNMSGAAAPSSMPCPPSPPSKGDWRRLPCAGGERCREAAPRTRYTQASAQMSRLSLTWLISGCCLLFRERSVGGQSC